MKKSFIIWTSLIFIIPISVFAAVTLIDNIQGAQVSTWTGGFNQKVRTINTWDLKFMNAGNDASMIGNYFVWEYYDEAYGVFSIKNDSGGPISIKSMNGNCWPTEIKRYQLTWYAYNDNFWAINFDNDTSDSEIYICIDNDTWNAYFEWYAYSPYIWSQSFDGIEFEANTNIEDVAIDDDNVEWRFTKVDGVASSSNDNLNSDFDDEVRVLWNLEKSSLKRDIARNVYSVIRNASPSNITDITSTNLASSDWETGIQNGKIMYISPNSEQNITISGSDNIEWRKTLIVEWGNIYITGNIRDSDNNAMLWLIALKKNGVGGNIYIDPTVTDIHAILYAEKSLISYNGSIELWWETSDSALANQLYIKWSVFSENTLGWAESPYSCPFYINSTCNENTAKKYDFNYLRRYRLVTETDADGNVIQQIPDYSWAESFAGDSTRGHSNLDYRKFPLIIEYDARIQQTPPPIF